MHIFLWKEYIIQAKMMKESDFFLVNLHILLSMFFKSNNTHDHDGQGDPLCSQCTICKNEPFLCQLMVIRHLWLFAFGKEAKGDKAFN